MVTRHLRRLGNLEPPNARLQFWNNVDPVPPQIINRLPEADRVVTDYCCQPPPSAL